MSRLIPKEEKPALPIPTKVAKNPGTARNKIPEIVEKSAFDRRAYVKDVSGCFRTFMTFLD